METRNETQETSPQLSPLSTKQWETLEEAEDMLPPHSPTVSGKAARTPGELEREIAQSVQDLETLLAQPHHHDTAMGENLLGVSDDLHHIAQDERLGGDPLLWRGTPRRFGRRPAPSG